MFSCFGYISRDQRGSVPDPAAAAAAATGGLVECVFSNHVKTRAEG